MTSGAPTSSAHSACPGHVVDSVVVGAGEAVWPHLLADFERGELKRVYRSCTLPNLKGMPAPRWDLIKGRAYGEGVTIASRGCPLACEYCAIPSCRIEMHVRRRSLNHLGAWRQRAPDR